jgi:hypothetical protein
MKNTHERGILFFTNPHRFSRSVFSGRSVFWIGLVFAFLSGFVHAQTETVDVSRAPDAAALLVEEWWDIPGEGMGALLMEGRMQPDQQRALEGARQTLYLEDLPKEPAGQRIAGWFTAPHTGEYQFHLHSNHPAQLFIHWQGVSEQLLDLPEPPAKAEQNRVRAHSTRVLDLQQGTRYKLELVTRTGKEKGRLLLGVTFPDKRTELPILAGRFLPPPKDLPLNLDTDGDGLSDYEESVIGSDPAKVSTSGDGISDFEKAAWNLDPRVSRSSPPLLPYAWCFAQRLPLAPESAWGDPDGDGLQNHEEFRLGSNPHNADSSGDGVGDFTAARILRLDPALALPMDRMVTLASLTGAATVRRRGLWEAQKDSASITTDASNGAATYSVLASRNEALILALDLELAYPKESKGAIWVEMRIDNRPVSRQRFANGRRNQGQLLFVLPVAEPGWKEVEFQIENNEETLNVTFHGLKVLRFPDEDVATGGAAQWAERWREGSLRLAPEISSPISPACVEGDTPFPDFLAAALYRTKDGEERSLKIRPLPDERWYADVSLAENGEATIVDVRQTATGAHRRSAVRWSITNLWTTELRILRAGDSLRLTAHPPERPAGKMRLTLDGVSAGERDVGDPLVKQFEKPGRYTLEATWEHNGDVLVKQVVLQVLDAGETSPILNEMGVKTWPWTAHAEGVALEADSRLVRQVSDGISVKQPGRYFLAARAGRSGPVLSSRRLEAYNIHMSKGVWASHSRLDGSHTRAFGMILDRVPKGLNVTVKLNSNHLTFFNGKPEQAFSESDIDGCGRHIIFFLCKDPMAAKPWSNFNRTYWLEDSP